MRIDQAQDVFVERAITFLGLYMRPLCLASSDGLLDGIGQLGELGFGFTPLLDVVISTRVDRLDDDLLAASPREQDERDTAPFPDLLQETDAIHHRHLLIGDDSIVVHFC